MKSDARATTPIHAHELSTLSRWPKTVSELSSLVLLSEVPQFSCYAATRL
jgi:hypothetical protein